MSDHTPGPWTVVCSFYIHAKGYPVAAATCGSTNREKADARLIAAAPELEDVAEKFMAFAAMTACQDVNMTAYESMFDEVVEAAKAALAKAQGAL